MIARIGYGAIFMILAPAALALWSIGLDRVVDLPKVESPLFGASLVLLGAALLVWAMADLWFRGGGLPMNAFPPRRLVEGGVYRLLAHPIYVGFALMCVGAAVWSGSPAGFWIVSPVAIAASAALVLGYEADAIDRLFGARSRPPLLSLPPSTDDSERPPGAWHRVSVYALVFLPWLVLYESVGHLPVSGAIDVRTPIERQWPVLVWAEPLYASVYLLAGLAPLIAASGRSLRWFASAGLVGTGLGMLCYLALPLISPPREFDGGGLLGDLLRLERADGLAGRAAFPSFHVFWAIIAARVWTSRWPRLGPLWWAWSAASIAACIATGMHAIADVVAGAALAAIAWRWPLMLGTISQGCERVANSWREWRIGPVRVISHAFWAGGAAMAGMIIAGMLAGPAGAVWLALVAVSALVGAALWGQLWVGGATSLRPFGYYGCVLGAVVALGAGAVAGFVGWREAAALCVAAPWVQAIGRFRCLVQGCCHGRATKAWWGIVYRHPSSRVCRSSPLGGVAVHPTPLYSMLANAAVGVLLARLWSVGPSAALVIGAYLILAGLARFVEEHFRGEPGTPVVAGLRVYQWFAVASVLAGMALSVWPSEPVGGVRPSWHALAGAIAVGVLWFGAMGVDVPGSSRRLSRLT